MHKIGIAITTTPVREISHNYYGFAPNRCRIMEYTDGTQKGVPASKNRCLKTLYHEGCDYFFLFDDDCYPIHPEWADRVIKAYKTTGIHHFNFMVPGHHRHFKQLDVNGQLVDVYQDCGGPFIFLTRKVIDQVGYANTAYGRWGFWHSAYSHRIWRAGLMPGAPGPFCSLPDMEKYIHSEDYDNRQNPKPNLTADEKRSIIQKNRTLYVNEISSNQLYYPFS